MWVVLEGEPDTVGFGGEAKLRGITGEGGDITGGSDFDLTLELFGPQQLRPEPLPDQPHGLNLDPVATGLGRKHPDRLRPVRTFEDRALGKLSDKLLGVHGAPNGNRAAPHNPLDGIHGQSGGIRLGQARQTP